MTAGRGRPAHWAELLAARFDVPDREALIAARLAAIEDAPDEPEVVQMVRAARARAAGEPVPPVLSRAGQVEAERVRLAGMSTAAIVAERAARDRECAALVEECRLISAGQEARLRALVPERFDDERGTDAGRW